MLSWKSATFSFHFRNFFVRGGQIRAPIVLLRNSINCPTPVPLWFDNGGVFKEQSVPLCCAICLIQNNTIGHLLWCFESIWRHQLFKDCFRDKYFFHCQTLFFMYLWKMVTFFGELMSAKKGKKGMSKIPPPLPQTILR